MLAAATGTLGGTVLYLTTDPLTTMLGVGNIALYAPIYTLSKQSTEVRMDKEEVRIDT